MRVARLVLPILLSFLLVSSVVTMAFNWWEAAAGAGAGAATGAVVGSLFPGLGTLAGAGIGALAGFIGASIPQLIGQAPTTTSNFNTWYIYAKDTYESIVSQSELIADNEIDQINLIQESQLPFTITAQKWEQMNYNANISPSSPYEFYQLLSQTGFLSYASKLIGGTQALWITEQGLIGSVDQQLSPYDISISYNVNPNATVSVFGSGSTSYFVIVFGDVVVKPGAYSYISVTEIYGNGSTSGFTTSKPITLDSGAYVIYFETYGGYFSVNPDQGAILIFQYGNSYSSINWGFYTPTSVNLYVGNTLNMSSALPKPTADLPFILEQIAVSMLGAAQSEYTVLKNLGYQNANQIPANMTLPTINLNIGNFSNFSSSLQAYNLYLAEYTRELLQIQQTLQTLSQEGKLTGLQQLNLNVTNPLSVYGQYGGFVTNGSIILPNGQTLRGLYLIQPYGGPLTLSSNGGIVGSGGAVAYQLVPIGNGTYGLGTIYNLPPNTAIQGNVENPGTLSPVAQPHDADYLNDSIPMPPPSSPSSSALLSNVENYLESHPLVLILTGLFVLIIVVALVRALL
jgi:hypothetical protein